MHVWQHKARGETGVRGRASKSGIGRLGVAMTLLVGSAAVAADPDAATSFAAEADAAMHRMMKDMAVQPSGDADEDFVAMMVPHHQGAIDMAVAELRFGKNEHLRRMAHEIIVEQQQEIVAMRLALDQPVTGAMPAPSRPGRDPAAPHDQPHGTP